MMCSGYATHLANLGVTVTQHPQNTGRSRRPKTLLIDGMPTTVTGQSISSSTCASTNQGDDPWVRLGLKKAYLVSLVRVIIFGSSGQNVAVRVGNSLTKNGNDNHQCGSVLYVFDDRANAVWKDVACSPPVWGRYINFDRTATSHFLEICEAAFRYGQCSLCCCQQLQLYNKLSSTVDAIVDISIESGGTNVDGHNFSVYQGNGLTRPINCTVIENTANYNISLTWKHNNSNNVQTFSSGLKPDVYQINENNMQQLYINNAVGSDDSLYSCLVSLGGTTLLSRSFTLNVNGTVFHVYLGVVFLLIFFFAVGDDCVWSAWSACIGNCGVGTQTRMVVTPKQHNGMDCIGPAQQDCDTNQPPCKTVICKADKCM